MIFNLKKRKLFLYLGCMTAALLNISCSLEAALQPSLNSENPPLTGLPSQDGNISPEVIPSLSTEASLNTTSYNEAVGSQVIGYLTIANGPSSIKGTEIEGRIEVSNQKK
jgi:hypothetical protein